MAYLQSDLPPSTAPARAAKISPAVAVASATSDIFTRKVKPPRHVLRFIAVLAAILSLVIPGYLAAQATESLAIGILAADLAFLVAVAGWSAVVGSDRQHH